MPPQLVSAKLASVARTVDVTAPLRPVADAKDKSTVFVVGVIAVRTVVANALLVLLVAMPVKCAPDATVARTVAVNALLALPVETLEKSVLTAINAKTADASAPTALPVATPEKSVLAVNAARTAPANAPKSAPLVET